MKTNPRPGPAAPAMASMESYGPETAWAGRPPAKGRAAGPAPAGALRRTYEGFTTEESAGADNTPGARGRAREDDDDDYVPRRGAKGAARLSLGRMVRGLARSTAGRVVLGCIFFVGAGAAAVGVLYARSALLRDARFVLASDDDIEVAGNVHLTRAQAVQVFGADVQRTIFRVPLSERRADLERLPWVRHATVERLLPNRLRVLIEERVPVAFVRQGTQVGLADANGVLLDMPEQDAGDPAYSFPVVTGIVAAGPVSTRAARMAIYLEFMRALDSTHEHLSRNISEVDVSDPEDVRALVAAGDADILVHFGEEQYLQRYQSFEAHLAAWRTQYPKLAAADMRYEGRIVLEMAHGEGAAPGEGNAAQVNEAAKPAAAEPVKLLSPVAVKAAPPVPVVTKAVPPKVVPAPLVAKNTPVPPAAKVLTPAKAAAPTAKAIPVKTAAKPKADGRSAANEKLFAELAAQHEKALLALAKRPAAKAVSR